MNNREIKAWAIISTDKFYIYPIAKIIVSEIIGKKKIKFKEPFDVSAIFIDKKEAERARKSAKKENPELKTKVVSCEILL